MQELVCDGLLGSAASMKRLMWERLFLGPLRVTSAKSGEGCDQLREAIVQAIDWKNILETTSPALYHRMKRELLNKSAAFTPLHAAFQNACSKSAAPPPVSR